MLKRIFENCHLDQSLRIKVLRIINEPTAAILPYIFNQTKTNSETILVIDCGGGTTDFTVMECDYEDMFFEVKNTLGNNFLGGEDLTNNIVDHICSNFIKGEISTKLYNTIRNESELLKCNLSYKQNTTININDQLIVNISRSKFIDINKKFFQQIRKNIQTVSDGFNIDRIVLVGGTTRIPYFSVICKEIFGDTLQIDNTLDPDQVISIGASIQANLLSDKNNKSNKTKSSEIQEKELEFTLLDIIPMTLGVETEGGIMTPIISKGSIIPISKTEIFSNSDDEIVIDINIYQGERKFVKDNLFLGSFKVPLTQNAQLTQSENSSASVKILDLNDKIKRNSIIIEVTFDINSDGMIIVTFKNKTTTLTNEKSIVINEYIKTKSNSSYVYTDDYMKLIDSDLANKILDKIDMNNFYHIIKKLLLKKVISKNKILLNDINTNEILLNDINTNEILLNDQEILLSDIKYIIDNFENYTVKELKAFKITFQEKWNFLHLNSLNK